MDWACDDNHRFDHHIVEEEDFLSSRKNCSSSSDTDSDGSLDEIDLSVGDLPSEGGRSC